MGVLLRMSAGMLALGLVGAQAQIADPITPEATPGFTPQATPALGIIPFRPQEQTTVPVPPRILNDTREYCDELRADISRIRATRGDISAEAAMLTREGERMCRIGHIRPGIYRLRSALIMLRRGE